MEKLLLKPSEVAQILGIGRSLVYELIARKEIPSVRLGRCIRVLAESLQQWLKDQESRQLNGGEESQRQDGEQGGGRRFTATALTGGNYGRAN